MAAGVASPYDLSGFETRELIHGQFPKAPGPRSVRDFSTTNGTNYGSRVPCNADCVYRAPEILAGSSIRQGAFYEKTGVRQHRLEPGFRDLKGPATYTELPTADYGTLRRSTRLPTAGSAVLGSEAGSRLGSPGAASRRSNASGASGRSRRSEATRSAASSVPSWAKRTAELQRAQPWDFNPLPMYRRSNDIYGSGANDRAAMAIQPAGQSHSGFVDEKELIRTLTEPRQ
jgi:hypothetical protein